MSEQLMTIADVAEVCNVSTRTVWRWIDDGDLQTVSLPSGRRRIQRDALDAILKPSEAKGQDEAA